MRELRDMRRLSQEALGELIGSDGPRIHKLEKGTENPTIETLDKLAVALNVDVSAFFFPVRDQEAGRGAGIERSPILEERFRSLLETLDAEVPAEQSWRGDILQAIAALNRALRRPPDPGTLADLPRKTGS